MMKKMLEEDNINIPFELELEIIKRLPVESLIRFRSVSKVWKSLIDSPDFIADYTSKVEHLLVNYRHYGHREDEYVLIVDDHTFPQQRISPTTPRLVETLEYARIIGSSRGLLCIHGYYRDDHLPITEVAVLWNVSIKKVVSVVLPKYNNRSDLEDLGFGVCSKTNDLKMVFIRRIRDSESISSFRHLEVEIFTLSTGTWRRLYNNLPRKSVGIISLQVVIDGFIYWLVIDSITLEDGISYSYLIVSFDITKEEFGEVNLPQTLAREWSTTKDLHLSKLRKSLVVIECDMAEKDHTFIVWMMEDGNSKSFTKLFCIYTSDASIRGVLEFRKTGEPLLAIYERDSCYRAYDASLVVYEPYSKRIANHVIDGKKCVFSVFSYTETLLLHDHPNFVIYDKGKCFTLKERAAESRRFSMHTNEKLNLWNRR